MGFFYSIIDVAIEKNTLGALRMKYNRTLV